MEKDEKDRKKRKKEKNAGKSKKPRLEDTVNEGEVPGSSECSEPVHSDDRKEQQQDEEGYDSFPQMKINSPVQDGSIAAEISTLYDRSESVMDDKCQNKEEGSESDSFSKMKIMPAHSRNKAVEQKDDSSEDEISYEMDRPTLLRQLQVILSEYPDDAQILRELVQNAEDAGASCMKIMYDNTEKHPKGNYSLCQYFKTPGIAVFNDGMFTDRDWKGIIKIYDSIKQDEPLKVGRFGLGFKSVFHMTDSPVIISGTKLLVIDPIRSERKENEVREFTLKGVIKHQDPQSTLACIMNWFGFEMDILKEQFLYKGTLFWFPLRQVESSLSATIYIPKKVKQLLHSFTEEATYNLLFLKNLEKIEIYNKGKMSAPFYKLELNGVKDVNFVEERAQFKEKLVSVGKEMPAKSITSKYEVVIKANGEKEEFNVVNCLFGTEEIPETMRGLLHDKELHYSPYTGVAYCTKSNKERKQPGHIFCFLPLPITDRSMTGLPFHVNGFFALEHNRRHLKEAASNCEIKGSDKSILWNESMIVELLPKTFRILIQQLKLKSESAENSSQLVDDVYCCIPDPELVQPCWKPMLENLFNIILEGVFFFSRQGNGKWIKLYDALVAYFDNEDTEEVQSTVKKFLLDSNSNLVELPNHVIRVLKYMKREPNKITPDIIADRIKKTDCWKSYTHDQKLHLLEFMLKTDNFSLLRSIELLPLKSGRFIEFETSSSEVLIAEDRVSNLFPGMDDRFVSRSVVTESIWGKLESIANGGFYQLKKMIPDDLPRLLYNVFDGKFTKKTKQIFIANNSDMFDTEWIKDVWKEIAAADFQDLVDFETLPIIPLIEHENKSVHEFLALKGLYIRPMDGYSVIGKVLQLMDVKLISEHDTIKFPHGDIFGKYILHPTNDNVMKILNDTLSSLMPDEIHVKAESINKQLNEENRIMLATYFEHGVMITSRETNRLLRNLKMFREHDNVSQPEMVSLEENCEVLDNFELQFPEGLAYPRKLIQSEHLKLAKLLDASLVNETECITDTLALMMSKNAMYTQKDIVLIMKYLQDPGKLVILRKVLENAKLLKFVNVLDKTHPTAAAADLFNPTINALTILFYGQDDLFPNKKFLEENGLEIELLEKLGLKGKGNITSSDLVGVATSIHRLQLNGNRNATKVQQKANALISCLKEQASIITDTLLDKIKHLSWVQPFQVRPEGYPPQLKWWNDHHFCCPSDVKSLKFKSLLGSTVPLVDKDFFHDSIVTHYRWEETPDPCLVIRHFKEVIESYEHKHNLQYLSSARDILQFFHETRQKQCLSEKDLDSLKKMRCIPTGSYGFKNPNMVVNNIERNLVNFNLEPFLFEMASEIKPFKETCLELGMLDAIDVDVLKMVLERVDSKYKEKEESSSTNEVCTDMKLVTNVLKTIVDMRIEKSNLVDLLVPIASNRNDILVLEPVEKCTYSSGKSIFSVSNLKDEDDDSDEDRIIYTHPDISDLAQKLGVASVTKRFMVDQKTAPMAWGQEEKLTTRISGLLDSYTDGLAVLKELIQNGDDAGAKQVNILYDERTNSDWLDGLFDPEMTECQGQALWVYNDAPFKEKDFQNIIKLGGKTKIVDTEKIGKFGLGFCSVYNITDVPSFISGKSMVILDPHLFYLGEAAMGTNPGLRIPLTKEFKKNFPNQFRPFNNVFGCNLESFNESEYNSTLFRLPLRTQRQAGKSHIRKLPYTKREVVELLEKFLEGAGNLLLFTQNVTDVCIYHLGPDKKNPDNEMTPVFKITKKDVMKSNNDYNVLKKVTSIMKTDNYQDVNLPVHCVDISIKTFENAIELSPQFRQGQVTQSWMISWATGSRSFELAKELREQGAIPVGSVAVPIVRKDDEIVSFCRMNGLCEVGFYKESHIFCFLPLPERTSLPVHINGCFNVEQDRKRIVYVSEDDKKTNISDWNDNMMKNVIPSAYLDLLAVIAGRRTNRVLEKNYWTLWPEVTKGSRQNTDSLVQYFYRGILTKPFPAVFHRKEKEKEANSCTIEQCVFLEPFFRSSCELGQYALECLLKFFNDEEGKVVMDMKLELYSRFKELCGDEIKNLEACILSKQTFFKVYFFPNLNDSYWKQEDRFEKRNALLKMAIDDSFLQSFVKNFACIPVKSLHYDILKMPTDLVYEGGLVRSLFSERDHRFPIDDFNEYSSKLVELGMINNELPSELLIERAHSVPGLKFDQAVIRSRAILQYLQKQSSIHEDVMEDMKVIRFLPVMKKPINWPIYWKADSLHELFLSSSEMYSPSDKNKVGSVGYIVDSFNGFLETKDLDNVYGFLQFQNVRLKDAVTQLEILGEENLKFSNEVEILCNDLYSELNSLLSSDVSSENFDCIRKRLCSLSDKNVVCLTSAVVKPNQVAGNMFGDCSPYLYKMDLLKYQVFWKHLLILDTFDSGRFITVIREMGKDYINVKMKQIDVMTLVNLLYNLCLTASGDGRISDEKRQGLVIPDEQCVLRPLSEVCFDDFYEGYLRGCKLAKIVHPSINQTIIKKLGIMSKRRFHLSKFSSGIPFGQKEKLVTRLKGIISAYPRDHSVLNELLQNADDAGASEIHFVLDCRQHGKKHVFDNNWKPLQGPALCVVNDTCFSETDLLGIQSLGEGSKSDDPTKTGKFGVGFNSVYHLTDVPSFLSTGPKTPNGGTFCVFDPHCKYVPIAEQDNPGMQIEDLDIFEESFKDVHNSFLQKELQYEVGTCFRLPLRTEKMAQSSEIRKQSTTVEDVDEMLKKMEKNMEHSLLFLTNVKRISISKIPANGKELTETKTVELEVAQGYETNRQLFMTKMKETSKSLKSGSRTFKDIDFSEARYEVFINGNRWRVVQGFGFPEKSDLPCRLLNEFSKTIGLLPRVGIAINQTKINGRAFCFLPLPIKTGLPVHINGHFALDQNRSNLFGGTHDDDIRFIWNRCLIEQSVANAYASALLFQKESLQQNVYRSSLSDFFEIFPVFGDTSDDWWKELVYHTYRWIFKREIPVFPICSTYIEDDCILHGFAKTELYTEVMRLHWVPLKKSGDSFDAVFDNLRCFFKETNYNVSEGNSNSSMSFPFMSNPFPRDIRDRPKMDTPICLFDKEQKIRNILIDLGMKLICTPMVVYHSIQKACLKYEHPKCCQIEKQSNRICICPNQLSPEVTIKFLKSWNTDADDKCLIGELPAQLSKTVLKQVSRVLSLLHFCYKADKFSVDKLADVPLLLTNDGKLQAFKVQNTEILSVYCDIFPMSKNLFIHRRECKSLQTFHSIFGKLDVKLVSGLLLKTFDPIDFKVQGPLPFPTQPHHINRLWLQEFWKCLNDLQCIDILKEWCLLPCMWTEEQQRLVSLDNAHVICDVDSFKEIETGSFITNRQKTLREIFSELCLPKPDDITINSVHIRDLVATYKQPLKLVSCLYSNRTTAKWSSLKIEDLNRILNYLNDEIINFGEKEKKQLRSLPMFSPITKPSQRVCLEEVHKCLVVKSEQLTIDEGLDILCQSTKTLLLKHNAYHEKLHSTLGCLSCYPVGNNLYKHALLNLYTIFILPNFSLMPTCKQLSHLQFVRDELFHHKDDIKFVLGSLKFIQDPASGTLKLANDFYSPHTHLFSTFCEGDLPPEPFCKPEWKEFMELAGMKTCITKDLFIRFAKQLQEDGRTASSEVKAKTLIENLFLMDNLRNENDFLEEISKINFIPPHTLNVKYSLLCSQFEIDKLIAFHESVSCEFANVVWTMQKILPSYATTCDNDVLQKLHVLRKPSICNVISHIHKVCNALLNQRPRSELTGKNLISSFYKYLEKVDVPKDELKIRLSCTPFIHILEHDTLTEAKNVVLNMQPEEEIEPYILKASVHYGQFFELFKELGVADKVSISHYCRALTLINQRVGDSTIIPNELKAIKAAIQGVLNCLSNRNETDLLNQSDNTLYLLNEHKKLRPSYKLVIADKPRIKSRLRSQDVIEFICGWSTLEITHYTFNADELLLTLPPCMRPKLVSDIVTETLTDLSPTPVGSNIVSVFREFINGSLFQYIVKRLAKTYQRNRSVQITEVEFESIFSKLQSLQVHALNFIETVLMHEGERLDGSEVEQQVFYDRNQHILYLNSEVNLAIHTYTLAEILVDVCNRKIQSSHVQACLPHYRRHFSDIELFLDDEIDAVKIDFELTDISLFPPAGTALETELVDFLVADFTSFNAGDTVVYEQYDDSGDVNASNAVLVYIYVKIIKPFSYVNERFPQYVIDVGNGEEKTVRSYRLYNLVRPSEATRTDIELFSDGNASYNDAMMADILQGLEETLVDAMKLGRDEFKRILRRIIRRWHPDKNQNSKFCEEVFKAITEFAKKLMSKHIDASKIPTYRDPNMWKDHVRGASSANSGGGNIFTFDVDGFAGGFKNYWRSRRTCYSYNEYVPDPQPHMARLWIQQAKYDISTACTALANIGSTSCNWICVLSHQAAEKALKAVQVQRDAKQVRNNHSLLLSVVYETGNDVLKRKVEELEKIIVNYSRLRYPRMLDYPDPPAHLYSKEDATRSIALATEIVEAIDDKYFQ